MTGIGIAVALVLLVWCAQTHMFDLIGTRWSPAARVAFYVLERFLAAISTAEEDALRGLRGVGP
jgi:hypothetical protein